jgi:hypothetical protein
MANPRMTLKDVADDMRSRGCGLALHTIADRIEDGTFPFGKITSTGNSGRRTFLIFRKDYESWAAEYLGG